MSQKEQLEEKKQKYEREARGEKKARVIPPLDEGKKVLAADAEGAAAAATPIEQALLSFFFSLLFFLYSTLSFFSLGCVRERMNIKEKTRLPFRSRGRRTEGEGEKEEKNSLPLSCACSRGQGEKKGKQILARALSGCRSREKRDINTNSLTPLALSRVEKGEKKVKNALAREGEDERKNKS